MMKIESASLDSIIPYARNPRVNAAAVSKVAASIKEFGPQQPIVVDSDNVIIAGHTRLLAAQQLKLDSFPVTIASDLSDAQVKAYRIADNRVGEISTWDGDMLKLEIDELLANGGDLDWTGFDVEALDELLGIVDELDGMPDMPDGDKPEFQAITFTLHDSQAEQVREAMAAANAIGPYIDSPNENSNGNAIARVCETFLTERGNA